MKITPRPMIALLAFGAYLVIFFGVWIATGVQYTHISDSASNLLRWYVLPLICGGLVLTFATTRFGWWRPAMFDSVRAPFWAAIPAVLTALLIAAMLATNNYSKVTGAMLLLTLIGSVGVGFSEELVSRGILLVGFRQVMSERKVWLFTCLCFGLLHLPNWVFGAGPVALVQVVFTFLTGSTLYLLRRYTGTLLAPMILHGLWDFAVFSGENIAALAILRVLVDVVALFIAFILTSPSRPQPERPLSH